MNKTILLAIIALFPIFSFAEQDYESSLKSFQTSCRKNFSDNFKKICDKAINNTGSPEKFFRENFSKSNITEDALFTGYYIPTLKGSLEKTEEFKYPLYLKPGNLNYTRAEINDGALEGQGLEFLYLNDDVELFFLQIQGSGIIELPSGEIIKAGFSAKNKHPYTSIGKYLIQTGKMEAPLSAQKIKKYLRENPSEKKEILEQNQSYVFFTPLKDSEIIGALGVELFPRFSVAVDKEFIPLGTPIEVSTTLPTGEELKQIMIAADTGSAIKGERRVDIFFGTGKKAEKIAGEMAQRGSYRVLVPKTSR